MTQPPQTSKQTGRRIVSKGKYAANVSKKSALFSTGATLYLLGLLGLVGTIVISLFQSPDRWKSHPNETVLVIGLVFVSLGTAYIGRRLLKKSVTLDTGVPLTRANTADLPAPDSLVRASAEPMQEPQAVLLRAATETQERHEEQLVRASAGGTE